VLPDLSAYYDFRRPVLATFQIPQAVLAPYQQTSHYGADRLLRTDIAFAGSAYSAPFIELLPLCFHEYSSLKVKYIY
jgi:hypothetical protein